MGLVEAIKKHSIANPISNIESSKALSHFLNNGFPTNKDEEWKYTSLKQLISNDFVIEQYKYHCSLYNFYLIYIFCC